MSADLLYGVCRSSYQDLISQYVPCLAHRHVFLSQMYSVGPYLSDQFHMVINDECGPIGVAQPPYLMSGTHNLLPRSLLHPQLHPSASSLKGHPYAVEVRILVGIM